MDDTSVHKIQEHIRKEKLSTYNRLRSIDEDAEFIRKIALEYNGIPVVGRPWYPKTVAISHYFSIANQRCGSWYVDPELVCLFNMARLPMAYTLNQRALRNGPISSLPMDTSVAGTSICVEQIYISSNSLRNQEGKSYKQIF